MVSETFGSWLKKERESRDMNQVEFAAEVARYMPDGEFTNKRLSQIENSAVDSRSKKGKRTNVPIHTLAAIAYALGYNPKDVFKEAGILDAPDLFSEVRERTILLLATERAVITSPKKAEIADHIIQGAIKAIREIPDQSDE